MKPPLLLLAALCAAGCSKDPPPFFDADGNPPDAYKHLNEGIPDRIFHVTQANYVVINYEFESIAGRGQGHFRTTFVGDYTPDSILTNQLPEWIGEISASLGTDVLRIVLCQVNHHRIIEL